MAEPIVECVPNFSEGRDPRTVDAIVNAISRTPGVILLGYESDVDHNRSVVTFAGPPAPVAEGALRGIAEAVKFIDLSSHSGVHPRIGAADVVPFVPVRNTTIEQCVTLAGEVGAEIWRMLRVPVYLYEAAARIPERRKLENIRRGGLPWLRDHITERPPDIGEARLHPTAGATVVGARKFLVAFNINLKTSDLAVARNIARAVRESSGGLPAVKAIGVPLASRGCVQVSINLTDFEQTGLAQIFEAVSHESFREGVEVASSELIGLVPRRAWEQAAAFLLRCEDFTSGRVLESQIEALSPARPADEFLRSIADPASPVGAGSAAAMTAALAASLGCKVARLSDVDDSRFRAHLDFFQEIVGRDANAFNRLLLFREAKQPDPIALQATYRSAATVAAELTERAKQLDRDLLLLKEQALPKFASEVMTALGLSRAARAGGIASAKAHLSVIADSLFRQEIEKRLETRP